VSRSKALGAGAHVSLLHGNGGGSLQLLDSEEAWRVYHERNQRDASRAEETDALERHEEQQSSDDLADYHEDSS
jgi:hypothetical protein